METQAAPTERGEWQKRVERWRDSGLSAEQFAADLGINAGTLKYWKYRLGKAAVGKVAAKARPTSNKELRAGSLVEVQGVTTAAPTVFVLELGRDRRLHIPPQFDAAALERLLVLLERR